MRRWVIIAAWVCAAAAARAPARPVAPEAGAIPDELPDGGWIALSVGPDGVAVRTPVPKLEQPDVYRQIYIIPTGYTRDDGRRFISDARRLVEGVSTTGQGVFTDVYRDRLVYIVQFLAGRPLGPVSSRHPPAGAPVPVVGGRVYPHPVREGQLGLTVDNDAVMARADALADGQMPTFSPLAVFVLFNVENPEHREMIPNAVLPTMLLSEQATRRVRGYGIVRMNRLDAPESRDAVVAAHELAHAALNLCDEYSEGAARGWSVTDPDPFTPLLLADGSPGSLGRALDVALGDLDIRFSECVAENAWDNVSLAREAPGRATFTVPGGMFFPRGTWHEDASSLMANSGHGLNRTDAHPSSHDQSLRIAFEGQGPQRPNARIRPAGPRWPLPVLGSGATVMLMDADKHHRWQPTLVYELECRYFAMTLAAPARRRGFLPTPTLTFKERVDSYSVSPTLFTVDVPRAAVTRLADAGLRVLNALGVTRIDLRRSGGAIINLNFTAQDLLDSSLPTGGWPIPYQPVTIRLPEAFTRYQWRFRTFNGAQRSDWTPWSTIVRAF